MEGVFHKTKNTSGVNDPKITAAIAKLIRIA